VCAVKVRYAAVSSVIELVALDIGKILNISGAGAVAGSIVE
jgi:hypothetical protein